jgi:hypothetical protein
MADIVSTADLISAIQSSLTVPVRSHSASTPGYDLYEVYLFGLCVEAAESIGMAVSFEDTRGKTTTQLILRTAPSTIWSQAQNFTHASLSIGGWVRLEVHLGIYLRAGSGVSHEGDIVVIEANEAARARVRHDDPRFSEAAVVIEAKFYGANVYLRTGREFLGLSTDIGKDKPILVSSSPGPSVHQLLSHRSRSSHFELTPGSIQENELKAQIATRLRDWLARYP